MEKAGDEKKRDPNILYQTTQSKVRKKWASSEEMHLRAWSMQLQPEGESEPQREVKPDKDKITIAVRGIIIN